MAGEPLWRRRWRENVSVVVVCAVIGSSSGGAYYGVFSVLLLVASALLALLWRRGWRVAVAGVVAAAAVAIVMSLNLVPSVVDRVEHGSNSLVTARGAPESENFGLKIAQLVLPVDGHRIPALVHLRSRYDEFPPRTEADSSTLGTAGTIGFVCLLVAGFAALGRWRAGPRHERERQLAAGAGVLVLVGTVGGGATLIALLVSTQIRSWNRVSIFVAFFCLAGFALLLDRLGDWVTARFAARPARLLMSAVAAAVVVVGIVDQASPALVPPYDAIAASVKSDRAFVGALERRLPRGAMVFQVPYVAFPEPQTLFGVGTDYDHLRGYLQSSQLRWSTGAPKGRAADWAAGLATKPPEVVVPSVAAAGFAGVWIDRALYGPAADTVQHAYEQVAHATATMSPDAHFSFVDVRAYAAGTLVRAGVDRVRALARFTLHPVRVAYERGFASEESDLHDTWHPATASSIVRLTNPYGRPLPATVRVSVAALAEGPAHLTVRPPGRPPLTIAISQDRVSEDIGVVLPPGTSSLRLDTDAAAPITPPGQPVRLDRMRVFPVDVTPADVSAIVAALPH
jgi:phosphoglycerol transferase